MRTAVPRRPMGCMLQLKPTSMKMRRITEFVGRDPQALPTLTRSQALVRTGHPEASGPPSQAPHQPRPFACIPGPQPSLTLGLPCVPGHGCLASAAPPAHWPPLCRRLSSESLGWILPQQEPLSSGNCSPALTELSGTRTPAAPLRTEQVLAPRGRA